MRHGGTRRSVRRIAATIGVAALAVTSVPGAAEAAPGDVLPDSRYVVSDAATPSTRAMGLAPDGSVYWAAEGGRAGTFVLGRATAAGPDTSLGGGYPFYGKSVAWDGAGNFIPQGVGVQSDGKIVVAGVPVDSARNNLGLGIVRVTPDGNLDPTFDGDGKVFVPNPAGTVAPQLRIGNVVIGPTGRIMVPVLENGAVQDTLTVRAFGTGGKPDKTYGTQGRAIALTAPTVAAYDPYLGLSANGKVVIGAGQCATAAPSGCSAAVVRLTGKGVLDSTFSGDGRADVPALMDGIIPTSVKVHALAAGHVLLTTDMRNVVKKNGVNTETSAEVMARFRPDGSPNPSFGGGDGVFSRTGTALHPDSTADAVVQPDGKLLVMSYFEYAPEPGRDLYWRPVLRRFNWNGTRDLTFGTVPAGSHTNILGTPIGPVVDADFTTYPTQWEYYQSMLLNADGTLSLATWTRGETWGGFTVLRMAL